MAPQFAVLGFRNADGRLGFALTKHPLEYVDRLRDGDFASERISQNARLTWVIPAQTHARALDLRNRWNDLPTSQSSAEATELSVPSEMVERLFGRDVNESSGDRRRGSPFSCPFVSIPTRFEPAIELVRNGPSRGISLAIFDLDMTLVDTSRLRKDRSAGQWKQVYRKMEQARPLAFRGGSPAHQIPALLSEMGIKVALISRAPDWYVNALVARFGIHADRTITACGSDKKAAFETIARRFGADSRKTIVFGDDKSDFRAAFENGFLSLGNPWTSTSAAAAPDVAWHDTSALMNSAAWHSSFGYVGEGDQDLEWHRGSLLSFDQDAFTLGRYFPKTTHPRFSSHSLSQSIYAGKINPSGERLVLRAFSSAIEHLAQRTDVDVVLSAPPHQWQTSDRFLPYRRIATRELGASDDIQVHSPRPVSAGYKGLNHAKRRGTRKGRFAISDDLKGQTVLLVDDVVTSGSTLGSLKDAAEQAGAGRVIQLAFGFTQDSRA